MGRIDFTRDEKFTFDEKPRTIKILTHKMLSLRCGYSRFGRTTSVPTLPWVVPDLWARVSGVTSSSNMYDLSPALHFLSRSMCRVPSGVKPPSHWSPGIL